MVDVMDVQKYLSSVVLIEPACFGIHHIAIALSFQHFRVPSMKSADLTSYHSTPNDECGKTKPGGIFPTVP